MKTLKTPTSGQFSHGSRNKAGFALIVTVTMMILLSLIAVGLLSLSSVTLRASTAATPETEARSNARLAAQMAIAELQRLSGLDTRVTASSRLIDETNVDVVGVWRSWEGTNHDSSGQPIAPDYDSKEEAGDPTEALGTRGSGRFLGYLTSTAVDEEPSVSEVPGSSTTESGDFIKMVSTGTVEDADGVYLEPTLISDSEDGVRGGFSWWITGDNAKALVNIGTDDEPETTSDWQQRLRGNLLPDPDVFGLSELDELTGEDMIIPTRDSLDLISDPESTDSENFYNSTTFSKGLLTNVATGGWRKDLSLFSEFFDDLPTRDLPLFSNLPGENLEFQREGGRGRPSNALLYHWRDYLSGPNEANWRQTPPICSWTALTNYMKLYEDLPSRGSSRVEVDAQSGKVGNAGDRVGFQEDIRLNIQVARVQWVLGLGADNGPNSEGDTVLLPGIVLTPIITVWNPYNVALEVANYRVRFDRVFPLRLSYLVDRTSFRDVDLNNIVSNRLTADLGDVSLAPGENKVYAVPGSTPIPGTNNLVLREGFEPNGGAFYPFPEDPNNQGRPAFNTTSRSSVTITSVEFASSDLEGAGGDGIGLRFTVNSALNNSTNIMVLSYNTQDLGGKDIVDVIYPPIVSTKRVTLGSVEGSSNEPFATATLGLRGISTPPKDSRFSNILTKGMLQGNPLQHYAEVGAGNDGNAITNLQGSGIYHPVNSPYDFIISEADSWNDSIVTVDTNSNDNGYLVTGDKSGDGLNRAIIAEIPTQPLQSLADLQHFDARNNNQIPPFQFNLIGNSSAHPIFAPDETTVDLRGEFATLSNDDSYLLNHVLFDDWFMSSIAPKIREFSSREEESIEDVFTQFLEGEEELPNRFYTPSPLAGDLPSDEQEEIYLSGDEDSDTSLFPFESVASLLEVEGMFNINSVSTDAWSAVLRRSRDLEIPFYNSSNSVTTEEAPEIAFPRTTFAGDVNNLGNSVITQNGVGALAGGYMTMDDSQIDAFAEEIVTQVRNRGPFLSLAEFVNRRLTSDQDLALAGTIQRALDMLAERSGGDNPFAGLQSAGTDITSEPPGATDYQFPEAAQGSTNFGVPGWARQADILRPLAPIMSARDDTFTIRAYGDSRDPSGTIVAQAWCEIVVQREAEFMDPTDSPQLNPHSNQVTSETNQRFGRRYKEVSFRWLKESEV